jgi:hypothetical protein
VPGSGVRQPWVQSLLGEPDVGGFGLKRGGGTGVDDPLGLAGWIEGEDDLAAGGPEGVWGAELEPLQDASVEAASRNVTIFRMLGKRGSDEDTLAPVP